MSSSNYKSWLTCNLSKLVLSHLTYFIVPILVLEYRPNRSVDDAVIMALHLRLLFMDFSYAFNTILPAGLQDTISQFNSRKHVRLVWFRLSVDQHCFPSGLCTLSSAYLYTLTAAPPITTPLNSRSLQLTPRSQGSPQVGLSLEQHGAQCYQNSRDDTGLPAPPVPIFQHACPVETVKSFNFLGTISQHLKSDLKISYFNKKPLPAPAEEI